MIIAEISLIAENFAMVRFSFPNEDFKNLPFNPVYGKNPLEEVKRRMYFKNREYIIEKLTAFLNQRAHARPDQTTLINAAINDLKALRNASLQTVVKYVNRAAIKLKEISPVEQSKFHNHYLKTIEPILSFCAAETKENDGKTSSI